MQFIGTATVIIRYQGLTILTDPNFLHRGDHVHLGYGMHSQRLTDPAIEFEDLPPIDLVLLSHLHEDHFDKLVEARLRAEYADPDHRFGGADARGAEASPTPIRCGSGITSMCARGRSRCVSRRCRARTVRSSSSALLPDVMGSMLDFRSERDGRAYRMYISGDTLIHEDLKEIPRRYRNIDLALLHLGGTRVLGVLVTMNAEQGIEALRIIRPDLAIPIHYNDYDVFKDPLENFVRAVERAGLQDKVRYLYHGESYDFVPRADVDANRDADGSAAARVELCRA